MPDLIVLTSITALRSGSSNTLTLRPTLTINTPSPGLACLKTSGSTGKLIREAFRSKINVTPKVTVVPVGTLTRSEKKTQRVFDHREE